MSGTPTIPGLHHTPNIPYKKDSSRLQILDIWTPSPPPSTPPKEHPIWLIYVHGGAWRDPLQNPLNVTPTLTHLMSSYPSLVTSGAIAGIASINYRLSPYPHHPTDPSDPRDADRNVMHPAHVDDVGAAMEYLVRERGMKRWMGVGHSCGATLLLQHVSYTLSTTGESKVPVPEALMLLAGIYDIPVFFENHTAPHCSEETAKIYRDIVYGAFGPDPAIWKAVSPVEGRLGGRYVLLAYSNEDVLVEKEQREVMLKKFLEEGWVLEGDEKEEKGEGKKGVVMCRELAGAHDTVWRDGNLIAEIVSEVVGRLNS